MWKAISNKLPDYCSKINTETFGVEVDNNYVYFDERTEDSFFKQLISIATGFDSENNIKKDEKGNLRLPTVCRYTSFSSFVRNFLVDNEVMCCIVGMNDSSECFSIEQKTNNIVEANTFLADINTQEIEEINKSFILSCSKKKEEDLTMWRLYGDNGKGVQLIYEYNPDEISKSDSFYLLPVVYDKKLMAALSSLCRMSPINQRYKFVFNRLSIWKYFFKSSNFAVEEEIRLLYKHKDKTEHVSILWVMNDTYKIVHPISIFNKEFHFPLKLKKIILGPNCAEKESNKMQLGQFIRDKYKEDGIEVLISPLKNYR